jgi:Protein of unknown function (DUF3313)
MTHSTKLRLLGAGALCALAAACASAPKSVTYTDLASASYLAPNTAADAKHIPYLYSTDVDWRAYDKLILDPVVIYQGSGQQFGALSDADKTTLVEYMSKEFAETLRKRFAIVNNTGAATLRVKLTLTGATKTTPVVGTFTHFDIGGNVYNGVQSVVGGRGAFSGEVMYAVEIYDAQTNRLLEAYVSKRYPRPYNLKATFGSLSAAQVGIKKGADALLEQLSSGSRAIPPYLQN